MRGDRIRRPLSVPDGERLLEELAGAEEHFGPASRLRTAAVGGWRLDDHCIQLPPEPPGPPRPGGSWEAARSLLADYEMADPSRVRAFYRPDQPLEGRTMLLEGRFLWMRFLLGVRIHQVVDETQVLDGSPVRIWGWSYRTLEGHLEMGEMAYEVRKWTETGAVDFRIHAVSRAAPIPNPVIRLGFRLFGRRTQLRFIHRTLGRMRDLVRRRLAEPPGASTGTDHDSPVVAATPGDRRPAS